MKKIYLLFAVAVLTIATSCNDESKNSKEMKHNEKEMKEMKK